MAKTQTGISVSSEESAADPGIIDGGGQELIGYSDVWSVSPGRQIRLMVSASAPEVDVSLVRLIHGDPNPAGPGLITEPVSLPGTGRYAAGPQRAHAGSYATLDDAGPPCREMSVWLWTATPALARDQVILARGGLAVFLDGDGCPAVRIGSRTLRTREPVEMQSWVRIRVCLGAESVDLEAGRHVARLTPGTFPPEGPVTLAASTDGTCHFNGKLEDLRLDDDAYDIRRLRLINAPTLAVTGRTWQSDTTDWRAAPDQYAAVHFHEDDLDDAKFATAATFTMPCDLSSGVYAFRLQAGDVSDHVPFVVTPRRAGTARIALLLPTLTYLAYANERLLVVRARERSDGNALRPGAADRWLDAHPEAGASLYDRHPDGSGVCLSSLLRPVPNFRPDYVWWNTGAPERFSSDLYITHFLRHFGQPWDAWTDHDLHVAGGSMLDQYPVVITGTHPEYATGAMLDALRGYVESGGHLLYLGGNGYYWVTSIDPERPHIIEVRRGVGGTRAWTSWPGEQRHQTTGEQGGLWRYRGHPPNELTGVGFAAQADTRELAAGYRRTAESFADEYAWIFKGYSGDEIIGDYGLYLGGAAGYEIDRHDLALGSPRNSVVLMTSHGLHSQQYLRVIEDAESMPAQASGPLDPQVRSDVAYITNDAGGAVFSVGSCSWSGSLSHNNFGNDIATITSNVLTRFLGEQL